MQQCGVKVEVALDPGAFDAVAHHACTAAADVGVGADVLAVDGDAERTSAGAGYAEPQSGLAGGWSLRWHCEVDRPRGGAALIAPVRLVVDVVRNLVDVPILCRVGFADGEVDVVGEVLGVFDVHAPVPVIVALIEHLGGAVRRADLEYLLAEVGRLPLDGPEVERLLAGGDGDAGCSVVRAEDTVGDGVKLVGARANVGDGEGAVSGAVGPELVVLGVVLPGDGLGREVEARGTRAGPGSGGSRRDIGAAVSALTIGEEGVINDGAVGGCRSRWSGGEAWRRRYGRRSDCWRGRAIRTDGNGIGLWPGRAWRPRDGGLVGERKADEKIGELRGGSLRVDAVHAAFDRGALVGLRIEIGRASCG